MTKIERTDDTHQLTTGCKKVSPGCANCYAERIHRRLAAMGRPIYQQPFGEVKCWPEQIADIESIKIPRKHVGPYHVFINSMSDLFHDVISHFLTKHPERMVDVLFPDGFFLFRKAPNIWLGVTVCNQAEADAKIPLLLQVPAAVRFVSIEPMLGPVEIGEYLSPIGAETCNYGEAHWRKECDCRQSALDWVISGGETGPGARPMHPDWVRSLRDQCTEAGVPFFFKGWGGYGPIGKKAAGRVLDGRTWEEFPNG